MSLMEICVVILTSVVVLIGLIAIVLTIFILRSLGKLNDSVKGVIEDAMIKETMNRVHTVLDNLEQSQQIINNNLPVIAQDASQIVTNISGITGKVDYGVGMVMRVLEKTPLSAIYTAVGMGRKLAKKFASRKKNKEE